MSATIMLVLRVMLAGLLYAFLGWALYTLWRDLQRAAQLQAVRQARPIRLEFGAGETQQVWTFTQPEVIIGRTGTCDIHLDDKTVSSRHTRLAYHHGQWWVEDLASTNGTFLNGEAVTTPVVLTQDDLLRCGQVTGRVSIELA